MKKNKGVLEYIKNEWIIRILIIYIFLNYVKEYDFIYLFVIILIFFLNKIYILKKSNEYI